MDFLTISFYPRYRIRILRKKIEIWQILVFRVFGECAKIFQLLMRTL